MFPFGKEREGDWDCSTFLPWVTQKKTRLVPSLFYSFRPFSGGAVQIKGWESFVCPHSTFRPQVLPMICFPFPSSGAPSCQGATRLPGCAVSLSSFYLR